MRTVTGKSAFTILICFLFSFSLFPENFSFGPILTGGISGGAGKAYGDLLQETSPDFDSFLFTGSAGGFAEYRINDLYSIRSENSLVFNRGIKLADQDGNYIIRTVPYGMESSLLGLYNFSKPAAEIVDLRVLGGIQYFYALKLTEKTKLGTSEVKTDLANLQKSSFGITLGGETEWYLSTESIPASILAGIRGIVPLTDRISYDSGEEKAFKTYEILFSLGMRF